MRILPLMFLVACVVCEAVARAQDDETRAHRPLLKRGLLAKSKSTTTTTPAPQEEEAEYEEYADGEEPQQASTEAPPSSTEGKKLISGGVRPFRSNTDLLETLKRRRAQAAEAKSQGHSTVSSAPAPTSEALVDSAPAKSSYSKKRFNNAPKESNNEEASALVKPSRNRFGRPSPRSVQEDHEEQNESAPAPARVGRTFFRKN